MNERLRKLESTLVKKDKDMEKLRSQVRSNQERLAEAEAFARGVDVICRRMKEKVDDVERKIVLPKTMSRGSSIGEVVSFNLQCVAKLKQLLKKYSTKSEASALRGEMEETCENIRQYVTEKYMSQNDFKKTAAVLEQTQRRHVALEALVSCKIDRSELGVLDAAKGRWTKIEESQQSIHSRIDDVDLGLTNLVRRLKEHRDAKEPHPAHSTVLRTSIEAKANESDVSVVITRLQGVATQQRDLEMALAGVTSALEDARNQRRQLRADQQKTTKTVIQRLLDRVESTETSIERALKGVGAAKKEVESTRVESRAMLEEAKKDLVRSAESKISRERRRLDDVENKMRQNDRSLSEMTLAREEFSDQIAVVLRFIDWFTERGSAYEHNSNVLERHLRDLVCQQNGP
eukprot:g2230.t1